MFLWYQAGVSIKGITSVGLGSGESIMASIETQLFWTLGRIYKISHLSAHVKALNMFQIELKYISSKFTENIYQSASARILRLKDHVYSEVRLVKTEL